MVVSRCHLEKTSGIEEASPKSLKKVGVSNLYLQKQPEISRNDAMVMYGASDFFATSGSKLSGLSGF